MILGSPIGLYPPVTHVSYNREEEGETETEPKRGSERSTTTTGLETTDQEVQLVRHPKDGLKIGEVHHV